MTVPGLATFTATFAGLEEHYVLIGGVATALALEQVGLSARTTKDLDIVLVVERIEPKFGHRLRQFLNGGGYTEHRRKQDGQVCRYRFIKPTSSGYPAQLEFFARQPADVLLSTDAEVTWLPWGDSDDGISALLMTEPYYRLCTSRRAVVNGLSVLGAAELIPLKAKAWLDLAQRRAAGESVDSSDIKKHRSDVVRLSGLLTEEHRVVLDDAIRQDLERFLTDATPITPSRSDAELLVAFERIRETFVAWRATP